MPFAQLLQSLWQMNEFWCVCSKLGCNRAAMCCFWKACFVSSWGCRAWSGIGGRRGGAAATCFANLTPLALQSPHHCQVFIEKVSFGIDIISILNLDNKISKYEFTPKVLATSIAFYKTPFLCFIDISKYSQLKIFLVVWYSACCFVHVWCATILRWRHCLQTLSQNLSCSM